MREAEQLLMMSDDEPEPTAKEWRAALEKAVRRNRELQQQLEQLKDEIAKLQKRPKRPKFKSSKLDEKTDASGQPKPTQTGSGKRPGSAKRSKSAQLQVDEVVKVSPNEPIPPGSTFKGYQDYLVQELELRVRNIRYRLARWRTCDGRALKGELPASLVGHFGPTLTAFALYQHQHCLVTQPRLREQLQALGVDISTGQVDALLNAGKQRFHAEKDALLLAGLSASSYVTVDDTAALHRGRAGFTTHIGNEAFVWFASTESKSRVNFLSLLRAGHTDYRLNEPAWGYLAQHKLPIAPRQQLRIAPQQHFVDETTWLAHLDALDITAANHRRTATEAALLGSVQHHIDNPHLAIVSDDAGQFDVLLHGLCWIHTERNVHKLLALNPIQRRELEQVRDAMWTFYAELKAFRVNPSSAERSRLEGQFDRLFSSQTSFETLNQLLKRIAKKKPELLRVLHRPDLPLHTNGSEQAVRDHVIKRKLTHGTRGELGQRARDTFASLNKTCRKHGIHFYHYLLDRLTLANQIPALDELVRQNAPKPILIE